MGVPGDPGYGLAAYTTLVHDLQLMVEQDETDTRFTAERARTCLQIALRMLKCFYPSAYSGISIVDDLLSPTSTDSKLEAPVLLAGKLIYYDRFSNVVGIKDGDVETRTSGMVQTVRNTKNALDVALSTLMGIAVSDAATLITQS